VSAPIRVLVVDDQRVVREGLEMLLGLLDGVEVAGSASDGEEALARVAETQVDVVLMDLNMPRMDGIEATTRMSADHPHVPVVVLTTYSDDERVLAALRAGARGYLTKDAGASEIQAALRSAASGSAHLDADVQRLLLDTLRSGHAFGVPTATGVAPDELTAREADVVRLIALGRSNTEIAEELVVSLSTVKTHVNHVFAKTGLRDRAQLVGYAYRTGLVEPPQR
jgi:DNA-binding NarL/FixJ family response regulator